MPVNHFIQHACISNGSSLRWISDDTIRLSQNWDPLWFFYISQQIVNSTRILEIPVMGSNLSISDSPQCNHLCASNRHVFHHSPDHSAWCSVVTLSIAILCRSNGIIAISIGHHILLVIRGLREKVAGHVSKFNISYKFTCMHFFLHNAPPLEINRNSTQQAAAPDTTLG